MADVLKRQGMIEYKGQKMTNKGKKYTLFKVSGEFYNCFDDEVAKQANKDDTVEIYYTENVMGNKTFLRSTYPDLCPNFSCFVCSV